MPLRPTSPSPSYWEEYSRHQQVKHDLLRHYLNGWLPKVGLSGRRLVYFETHGGRGRHQGGQPGSPLVALRTVLDHVSLEEVLQEGEFRMGFAERDPGSAAALQAELDEVGALPDRLLAKVIPNDGFETLSSTSAWLHRHKDAAAFIFVDPYGFSLPGDLLRDLLSRRGVELFINLMWREVDMAMAHGPDSPQAAVMDRLFADRAWRSIDRSQDLDGRADQALELFQRSLRARWATSFRMRGDNDQTRYLLVHLTNSDAGRDLMKDCLWRICPHGGFYARKSEGTMQVQLLTPEPDRRPLSAWLDAQLRSGPVRWSRLEDNLRSELWRAPQLAALVKARLQDGSLRLTPPATRFVQTQDPQLGLPDRR